MMNEDQNKEFIDNSIRLVDYWHRVSILRLVKPLTGESSDADLESKMTRQSLDDVLAMPRKIIVFGQPNCRVEVFKCPPHLGDCAF